ncbi:hypothetical protein Bbelb_173610 [Branchiostoma belcheri]|nr:hypothetical protein Bbelb_173610 [Branchiostoma belcheri]
MFSTRDRVSIVGVGMFSTEDRDSSVSVRMFSTKDRDSSVSVGMFSTKDSDSSVGVCMLSTKDRDSSVGIAMFSTKDRDSSVGVRMFSTKHRYGTVGVAMFSTKIRDSSVDSVDAVVRRCVDEQARAYVAETVVTPARVCKAEKAFLNCFDAEGFPERAEAGLAVLRSVVMGQYVTTVLPFCGTVNHGDKLRDVNKNAAGDCTILDVQNCFARAVFSLPGAWTPCVVQPLAFGCYMRECLGPKVGPAPNIVSHVMAYHLNSTLTEPGLCDHMETSRITTRVTLSNLSPRISSTAKHAGGNGVLKEAIYERMYNPTLNREGGLRVDLSGTCYLALPAPRTDNT